MSEMALQDGCHYFELVIETSVEGSGSFEFGLRFGRHARFVHEEHAQVSILIDKSQLIAGKRVGILFSIKRVARWSQWSSLCGKMVQGLETVSLKRSWRKFANLCPFCLFGGISVVRSEFIAV